MAIKIPFNWPEEGSRGPGMASQAPVVTWEQAPKIRQLHLEACLESIISQAEWPIHISTISPAEREVPLLEAIISNPYEFPSAPTGNRLGEILETHQENTEGDCREQWSMACKEADVGSEQQFSREGPPRSCGFAPSDPSEQAVTCHGISHKWSQNGKSIITYVACFRWHAIPLGAVLGLGPSFQTPEPLFPDLCALTHGVHKRDILRGQGQENMCLLSWYFVLKHHAGPLRSWG